MNKLVRQEIANNLDQFYTNPVYAQKFFETIKTVLDIDAADILLEPSAGSGSFLNLMDEHKRIGIDIDPKYNEIVRCDFLNWNPPNGKRLSQLEIPLLGKIQIWQ